MSERALTLVHPHCPVCGSPCTFTGPVPESRDTLLDAVPCTCDCCDWDGESPAFAVVPTL